MNFDYKRILYINLEEQTFEFKIHEDLWKYVGGIAVSYKLVMDNYLDNPMVLTCGPLSGFFPYVSKSSFLYLDNGKVIEKYGGGNIAMNMNLASIDGIVILGVPSDFIKVTVYDKEVIFTKEDEKEFDKTVYDFVLKKHALNSLNYFSFRNNESETINIEGGFGIKIETSRSIDLSDFYDYENLYNSFLNQYKDLTVEPRNNPSCAGCPMGCDNSAKGEDDLNIAILPRCLISCGYAEEIYKNIPNVYAALNSVGYRYHHSHLENLPKLVGEIRANLAKRNS